MYGVHVCSAVHTCIYVLTTIPEVLVLGKVLLRVHDPLSLVREVESEWSLLRGSCCCPPDMVELVLFGSAVVVVVVVVVVHAVALVLLALLYEETVLSWLSSCATSASNAENLHQHTLHMYIV